MMIKKKNSLYFASPASVLQKQASAQKAETVAGGKNPIPQVSDPGFESTKEYAGEK